MVTEAQDPTKDPIGRSEYRVDLGFVLGYLVLYVGLLVFRWDARYIILGVSLELALIIVGALAKAYLLSRDRAAQAVATVLCLPALLIAIGLGAAPLSGILEDETQASTLTHIGIAFFFLSSVYSRWQRFRRTTLRLARFSRYFEETYVFADGKRIIGPLSQIMSAVLECWMATLIFAGSWGIAVVVGAFETGNGDMTQAGTLAGVTLVTLCLLRELATIGIIHLVHRNRPDLEEYWLDVYSKVEKIVRRDGRDL